MLDDLLEASGGPLSAEEEAGRGSAVSPLVLDAGAPIAIERGNRRVLALCKLTNDVGDSVVVPTGVVGQVWRDGAPRAAIDRLVGARGTTVKPLDIDVAKVVGSYRRSAGTNDVIDATG